MWRAWFVFWLGKVERRRTLVLQPVPRNAAACGRTVGRPAAAGVGVGTPTAVWRRRCCASTARREPSTVVWSRSHWCLRCRALSRVPIPRHAATEERTVGIALAAHVGYCAPAAVSIGGIGTITAGGVLSARCRRRCVRHRRGRWSRRALPAQPVPPIRASAVHWASGRSLVALAGGGAPTTVAASSGGASTAIVPLVARSASTAHVGRFQVKRPIEATTASHRCCVLQRQIGGPTSTTQGNPNSRKLPEPGHPSRANQRGAWCPTHYGHNLQRLRRRRMGGCHHKLSSAGSTTDDRG